MAQKATDETLSNFLSDKVFAGEESYRMEPKEEDVAGFEAFIERYKAGFEIERAAVETMSLLRTIT